MSVSSRRLVHAATVASILVFGCSSAVLIWGGSPSSAAGAPSVTVSPAGPYRNGQTITVSIGANNLFTPNQHINIIECSDFGGTAAGLPKSIAQCDGNTIQGGTVVIGADGAFTEKGFVVYSLPNQNLAELVDGVPVCNTTHPCVLYVGQNQEDFTQPKVFSAPFTVTPTPGSTPTAAGSNPTQVPATPGTGTAATVPTTTPAPTASSAGAPGSSGTADPAQAAAATSGGQLAFTGFRPVVAWLFWLGSLMVLLGSLVRRLARGARS